MESKTKHLEKKIEELSLPLFGVQAGSAATSKCLTKQHVLPGT